MDRGALRIDSKRFTRGGIPFCHCAHQRGERKLRAELKMACGVHFISTYGIWQKAFQCSNRDVLLRERGGGRRGRERERVRVRGREGGRGESEGGRERERDERGREREGDERVR